MMKPNSETISYVPSASAGAETPHLLGTVSRSVATWGRTAADWLSRRGGFLGYWHPAPLNFLLESLGDVHDPAEVPELLVDLAGRVAKASRVELHRRAGPEHPMRRVAAWPNSPNGSERSLDERRSLCIPLPLGAQTWGELRLWPGRRRHWPRRLVRQLATLGIVATAAEWAVRAGRNVGLATPRDPLTGLYNETFLDALLEHAVAQARRRAEPLAMLQVAIVGGAWVEPTDPSVADSALQRMAHAIAGTLRSSDILARLDGGGIAAVLPGARLKHAHSIATAIRLAILEAAAMTALPGCPTITIGLAAYPEHATDAQTLRRAASAALTAAREAGGGFAIAQPVHLKASPSSF